MMNLPTFSRADPTPQELRLEQVRLQQQSDKMMESTSLLDVLAVHGKKPSIHGSYGYGLMVYPDLDLGVVDEQITRSTLASVLSGLAKIAEVSKISVVDTLNYPPKSANRPKGYWIGVEVPFEADVWGIDLWLQHPSWVDAANQGEEFAKQLAGLDEQSRDAILAIKYQLIRRNLYGSKFSSADVYTAMLDGGVRSIEDFLQHQSSKIAL